MLKTIRYIDAQGRIILPAHIRKALNLTEGSCVEVDIEDDGTIKIKPTQERCHICGRTETPYIRINEKLVCLDCAEAIAEHVGGRK